MGETGHMALRFLAAAPSSDLLTLPWNTSLELSLIHISEPTRPY